MRAQLLRDGLLIEPEPRRDDVTATGIITASRQGIHTSQEQLGRTGRIVAVGAEIDGEQLKVGDRVLFGEFDYAEYVEDGRRYLRMRDDDICGVIE